MFKASIHHYHNVLRADYLHISLPPTSLYLDIFFKNSLYLPSFFLFFSRSVFFLLHDKHKENKWAEKKYTTYSEGNEIKWAKIWIEKHSFDWIERPQKRALMYVRRLFRPHAFLYENWRSKEFKLFGGQGATQWKTIWDPAELFTFIYMMAWIFTIHLTYILI